MFNLKLRHDGKWTPFYTECQKNTVDKKLTGCTNTVSGFQKTSQFYNPFLMKRSRVSSQQTNDDPVGDNDYESREVW